MGHGSADVSSMLLVCEPSRADSWLLRKCDQLDVPMLYMNWLMWHNIAHATWHSIVLGTM